MSVTPLASGGTMTSSITVGGRSMPSMRGIEKPHTSASIAATLCPRSASATARLVVTDDLPTPPLPDAIASTRVRESMNGLGAVLVPVVVGVRAATVEALRERGALLVGHDREVDVDVPDAGEGADRVRDPLGDLGPQRAAGDRQRDRDPHAPAVDDDPPHHVEIDDRLVDLGVLDRAQGLDHLGLGGHRGGSGGFPLPA